MSCSKNWKDVRKMCNAEADDFLEGLQFVLPFLDLRSQFNVERISKAVKQALKDPLLWVDLTIDWPETRNLTNRNLLKLVKRADGHLKSLFLNRAYEINDDTMIKIFELNPALGRISLLRCLKLDDEKFVSLVEAHSLRASAKGLPGISEVCLRGGLGGMCVLPKHRLRLVAALKASRWPRSEASLRSRYYESRHRHSDAIDEQPVDVEMCPRCSYLRLTYSRTVHHQCPKDEYSSSEDDYYNEMENDDFKNCKSCRFHIARCEECTGKSVYAASWDCVSLWSDSDWPSDTGSDSGSYYRANYGTYYGANYGTHYNSDYFVDYWLDYPSYYGSDYSAATDGEMSDNVADTYPKENHHFNRRHQSRRAYERSSRAESNMRLKRVRLGRDSKGKHQSSLGIGLNLRPRRVRSGRSGKGKHQSPLGGPLGLIDIHLKAHTMVQPLGFGGCDNDDTDQSIHLEARTRVQPLGFGGCDDDDGTDEEHDDEKDEGLTPISLMRNQGMECHGKEAGPSLSRRKQLSTIQSEQSTGASAKGAGRECLSSAPESAFPRVGKKGLVAEDQWDARQYAEHPNQASTYCNVLRRAYQGVPHRPVTNRSSKSGSSS